MNIYHMCAYVVDVFLCTLCVHSGLCVVCMYSGFDVHDMTYMYEIRTVHCFYICTVHTYVCCHMSHSQSTSVSVVYLTRIT